MLYNDFRPKTFNDMIGQNYTAEILRNQVKTGNPSHAYLFCGARGTGKTTAAKIMAKAVNCLNPKDGEPCNECEMCKKIDEGLCTDVVELDAASHNGVDDIRNIINTLKYPSVEAKYKVFIIDECHMLSQGAVNAFLKTLEEPPKNVIFILATTDPQKLPVTILSRCQKFDFRRIKTDDILKRLKYVSEKVDLKIEDKSLYLIAKLADGAMRDALSILDQTKSLDTGNGVEYSKLLELLGASTNGSLFKITENIFLGNTIPALNCIDEIDTAGKDLKFFTKDLIKFLRNALMTKVMGDKAVSIIPMADEDIKKLTEISKQVSNEKIITCIETLQSTEAKMQVTSQLRVTLELAIIKMTIGKEREKAPNKDITSKQNANNDLQTQTNANPNVKINKNLNTAMAKIIAAFNKCKTKIFQDMGIVLGKSKFSLSKNNNLIIYVPKEGLVLLQKQSNWILKGLKKCDQQINKITILELKK